MQVLKDLVEHLRNNRTAIVKEKDVLCEVYDLTFGLQAPRSETIEYVDFDALCDAIDDFAETFQQCP